MHFCLRIIAVLKEATDFLLFLQDIFIPCVIQSFLSFIHLYLLGKQAWKILKKVHRDELYIWLGSVSI